MVVICAWCRKYLGMREPYDGLISHSMCPTCQEAQEWSGPLTLVVSRRQARLLPVLEDLLQSLPDVRLVVERRRGDRRRSHGGTPPPGAGERRREGRRRRDSPILV